MTRESRALAPEVLAPPDDSPGSVKLIGVHVQAIVVRGDRITIGRGPGKGAVAAVVGIARAGAVVGRSIAHPMGEVRIPEIAGATAVVGEMGAKAVFAPVANPAASAP